MVEWWSRITLGEDGGGIAARIRERGNGTTLFKVPCLLLVGKLSRVGSSKKGTNETPSTASVVTGTPANSAMVGYKSTSSAIPPVTLPADRLCAGARTMSGTRTPSSKFVYCEK